MEVLFCCFATHARLVLGCPIQFAAQLPPGFSQAVGWARATNIYPLFDMRLSKVVPIVGDKWLRQALSRICSERGEDT